jgi:hypothetical protein
MVLLLMLLAQTVLPLLPEAELRGRLTMEKGVDAPRQLEASFTASSQRLTVTCPVARDGTFQCRLPERATDIRLAASDFAPHYLWGVALSRERALTIPPFALKRGGSIAGWISTASREIPKNAAVRLVPVMYGGHPDDVKLLTRSEKPNARGFFQFTGISAGDWRVIAEAPEFSPSSAAEVRVDERKETTLRDALLLQELVDLSLSITPEVFAPGRPWRVRVVQREHGSPYTRDVVVSDADENGRWNARGVAAGEYWIEIADHRKNVYSSKSVSVDPGMAPLAINIDAVPVKGRVRVGDEGIAAHLTFLGRSGQRLTATSDADGNFKMLLPAEGKWEVRAKLRNNKQELGGRSIEIVRKEGEPHADVDLEFPGGRIAGEVVDESGKRIKAGVNVTRNGSLLAHVPAEDGVFEVVGLSPGPAFIEAGSPLGSSGGVPVSIDDHASPVTLVVRGMRKVDGWLLGPSGEGIPGASIRYYAPNAAFVGDLTTSPSGRFTFEVEADAAAVNLVVIAPGWPCKLTLARIPEPGRKLEIVLGRTGGRMVIPPRGERAPYISHDGAWANVMTLLPPVWSSVRRPSYITDQGVALDVEPGEYAICPTMQLSEACVKQVVR